MGLQFDCANLQQQLENSGSQSAPRDPHTHLGRVFRAAAPVLATPADVRQLYNDLSVKELIDLRSSDELSNLPDEVRRRRIRCVLHAAGKHVQTRWCGVARAQQGPGSAVSSSHLTTRHRGFRRGPHSAKGSS
jgi:hypothetical protein